MNSPSTNLFVENRDLFKNSDNTFSAKDKNPVHDHGTDSEKRKKKTILGKFWEKLIHNPGAINKTPQTSISRILQEGKGISNTQIIKSVLAKKLNLPENSEVLLSAIEKTRKIFHEDFPADFILEYKGERLGMALLDVCYDCHNNQKLVYKFNEELKSFKGMY